MTKIESSPGEGTKENPCKLKTPAGSSQCVVYKDDSVNPPILGCKVGSTTLDYQRRCIEDLHSTLKRHSDRMEPGGTDEQKPAKKGTVEAWGRSVKNPAGGWYGLKKGFRGRSGMYVPPLMEALTLAELEHNPQHNSMRA